MIAEKGNKVYTIEEGVHKRYQQEGFDIKDDAGNVVLHGKGKTVPIDEYMKAVKEIERLQTILTELQTVKPEEKLEKDEKTEKPTSNKGK